MEKTVTFMSGELDHTKKKELMADSNSDADYQHLYISIQSLTCYFIYRLDNRVRSQNTLNV